MDYDRNSLAIQYAQRQGVTNAVGGNAAQPGQLGQPGQTEIVMICDRFAVLLQRAENLAVSLENTGDRLLGSSPANPGAQGNTPQPVPNGILQTMTMGLNRLEQYLEWAAGSARRIGDAI